jgi:hypothetical protein
VTLKSTSLAVLLTLGLAAPLSAAPLQPHAATYEFKLIRSAAGSGVANAAGHMTYRLEDACRGWNAGQKATITMELAQAGSYTFGWSLESWESKDGQDYRFFIKHVTGGEVEESSGSASLDSRSASVSEGGSAEQELPLPSGTLFPTAFTEKAIAAAEVGQVLLAAPLYDGGSEDDIYEVSMIMGKEIPVDHDLANDSLSGLKSWQVRAAFFKQQSGESAPDQEQAFRLFENGVIDRLQLDMGDFVIEGRLTEFELLPGC